MISEGTTGTGRSRGNNGKGWFRTHFYLLSKQRTQSFIQNFQQKKRFSLSAVLEPLILIFTDWLALFLSILLSSTIVGKTFETILLAWKYPSVFIIFSFFLAYEKLYSRRFTFWDEIIQIIKACIFSWATGLILNYIMGSKIFIPSIFSFSILWIIVAAITTSLRVVVKEALWHLGLRKKCVILGAGKTGRLLLQALENEKTLGYDVLGFLDDDPTLRWKVIGKQRGKEIKVLGPTSDIDLFLNGNGLDEVIVAMPGVGDRSLVDIANVLQNKVNNVTIVPDLFGIPIVPLNLHHFFGERMILLSLGNNLAKPFNRFTKEVFDKVFALILLVISLPVLLISAILIKISSRGPVIYPNDRIGKGGRRFKCYKFRTMYVNSNEMLKEYLDKHPEDLETFVKTGKICKNDPRATKVGKILRKLSIDELPQLINVLKGDMSLVGPRALIPEEVELDKENYFEWAKYVKPGITGLAQIMGRANMTHIDKNAISLWYVRNWSLWLDIVIILKSIKVVLKMEGAY